MSGVTQAEIRSLYDVLFILQLLAPVQNAPQAIVPASFSTPFKSPWEKFLDNLALLIDYDAVVPSIAVQRTEHGKPRYWIATNDPSKQGKCIGFLTQILRRLDGVDLQQSDSRRRVKREICQLAIHNCKGSVKEYRRCLIRSFDAIRSTVVSGDRSSKSDREKVFEYLEETVVHAEHHFQACSGAYLMRHNDLKQCLKNIINEEGIGSEWDRLRHYIGRLGVWIKATGIVVSYCGQHQGSIRGFEILASPPFPFLKQEQPFVSSNLSDILVTLPSDYAQEGLQRLLQDLHPAKFKDFSSYLKECTETFKITSLLHSEVTLFENFLKEDYRFWNDEECIGCSKMSCFCCSHYLDCRSQGRIRRASHGNAYMTWGFPRIDSSIDTTIGVHKESFEHISRLAREYLYYRITESIRWHWKSPDSVTEFATASTAS